MPSVAVAEPCTGLSSIFGLELLHDDRSNAAIANGKQNLMFLFIFKLCFCSNYLLLTKHNANHILTGRHT